eukprot:PhM_4_TR10922/c2_g1_i1/m.92201
MLKHIRGHGREVVLGLPAPVAARKAVVQRVRPRVRDVLQVRPLVLGLERRHVLLHLRHELLRREGHARDVVHAARELLGRGLEQRRRGLEAVGHVHHGQGLVAVDAARERLAFDGGAENVCRVVGRATAGHCGVRYDARVAQTAEVDAELVVVVCAELLVEDLAGAVDGRGVELCVVERLDLSAGRTEHRDRRRGKHSQVELAGDVEGVARAVGIDVERGVVVGLALGALNGRHVHEPVDAVVDDHRGHLLLVLDVEIAERAVLTGDERPAAHAHVGGQHTLLAVASTQEPGQVGADLSQCTRDENSRRC